VERSHFRPSSPARGSPAVIRRAILEESGVAAERMALGVGRVCLTEDLAGAQDIIVDLL
jgi:hypothetical protein